MGIAEADARESQTERFSQAKQVQLHTLLLLCVSLLESFWRELLRFADQDNPQCPL